METRNRLSILAAASVAVLVACSPSHPASGAASASASASASGASSAGDAPQNTVVVQVAAVTKRDFTSSIIISGTIGSETEARLSFKTGGIIESMKVRDGDQVRQGQLLATLNPTEINAQVEQAKEGLDKAQRDLARARDLFTQGVATQEQLDNAATAFSVAQQTVEIARFNQGRSEIFAPAAGVVLRKLMNEGELAAPGMPVFLFAGDEAREWVLRCGVSDRNWARLAKGDKAAITFDAFPGETFQGAVSSIARGAEAASGLYQVEVKVFPGARILAAGLFGTGTVQTGENGGGLAVPVDALVEGNGDQAKVFVARRNVAAAVEVRVLELTDRFAVVRGNLAVGDNVVVRGAPYLQDGSRIRTAE
jgi:membrane fusion protein, multidrug efflux system